MLPSGVQSPQAVRNWLRRAGSPELGPTAPDTRKCLMICQSLDITCQRDFFECSSCLVNIVKGRNPGQETWKPRVQSQLGFLPRCVTWGKSFHLFVSRFLTKSRHLSRLYFCSQLMFHFLREAFPDAPSKVATSGPQSHPLSDSFIALTSV